MPSLIRKREWKLKNGKTKTAYLVRVKLPDGEVIRKTFDKKGDAEIFKGRLLNQRKHGDVVRPSAQPLGAYLADWLEGVRHTLRENTHQSYTEMVGTYIAGTKLAGMPLDKINQPAIQAHYDKMTEDGLSPRTIRYLHSILHTALADAVGTALNRNPAKASTRTDRRGVKLPKKTDRPKEEQMRPLDLNEARRFLAIVSAADDELDERRPTAKAKSEDAEGTRIKAPMAALFYVLITAGLRPSEAFALRWSDIDLEQGSVRVSKSLTRISGSEWKLNPTKTESARRTVPVPPETIAALRRHRTRQAEHRMKVGGFWRDQGFVFTTAFGDPCDHKNTVHRHFKTALRKLAAELHPALEDGTISPERKAARAEVMRTRFYDLRHTFATLSLSAGVDVKVVSERLGHKSIVITLDTYAHVLPSMQEEATRLLGASLFG